jgi:hypothetical protein
MTPTEISRAKDALWDYRCAKDKLEFWRTLRHETDRPLMLVKLFVAFRDNCVPSEIALPFAEIVIGKMITVSTADLAKAVAVLKRLDITEYDEKDEG